MHRRLILTLGLLLWPVAANAACGSPFTVGVGGAYADINAVDTAIYTGCTISGTRGGTLKQDIVIGITRGGVTTTTRQVLENYVSGGFRTTIQPVGESARHAPSTGGQGFRDYLNAPANRGDMLHYDPAYGAFIHINAVVNGGEFVIDVDNTVIFGMQFNLEFNAPGIDYGHAVRTAVLDSNIILASGQAHGAPGLNFPNVGGGGSVTVENNLLYGRNTVDFAAIYGPGDGALYLYSNTCAQPLLAPHQTGGTCLIGNGSSQTVNNNLAIGFIDSTSSGGFIFGNKGGRNPDSATNNATSFGVMSQSDFLKNAQVNATIRTWNTTSLALLDFRIPSGSTARGHGGGSGIPSVDILGRRRNTPDDIGAWAYH